MERTVVAVPRQTYMLALPGLTLAVAGLFHPHHLTYDTSWQWFALHVPGLLVFPLVGLALAELVHGRTDAAAWVVRLTAYVYATFYSALDVISGIAAGYVTHELGPGVPRPAAVSLLFRIGTPLGHVGSVALIACCSVVTLDLLVRRRAWPALVLVPGAVLVHVGHIFAPTGVAGMLLLGLGTAGAAWWARRGNLSGPGSVIVV
jgi:hypothetical protein